jgi:predicted ATPase
MQCEWQDPEMLDAPKPVFRTTELDPHLLATGFEVQTNWHVVTGAPSSGKSTLIDQVAGKGFRTISEIARHYFERELAKGRTIDDIHADPARLQRGIQAMQLAFERGLQPLADVFLDGALPGSMAWYRAFGLDPNEVLAQCFHHRYASVFVLEPLPFEPDEERVEAMAALVGFLNEWLARDYTALGYDVVRVPVLPPKERLSFVLERLSEQGLV